jgi:hypothetical protein
MDVECFVVANDNTPEPSRSSTPIAGGSRICFLRDPDGNNVDVLYRDVGSPGFQGVGWSTGAPRNLVALSHKVSFEPSPPP